MDFSFDIGIWAIIGLAIGSVVLGLVIQLIGEPDFGLEWLITAVGAFVGGFCASEFVVGWRTWDPVWDSMALIPAIIGGLVVGIVVAAATRFLTTDHSTARIAD